MYGFLFYNNTHSNVYHYLIDEPDLDKKTKRELQKNSTIGNDVKTYISSIFASLWNLFPLEYIAPCFVFYSYRSFISIFYTFSIDFCRIFQNWCVFSITTTYVVLRDDPKHRLHEFTILN